MCWLLASCAVRRNFVWFTALVFPNCDQNGKRFWMTGLRAVVEIVAVVLAQELAGIATVVWIKRFVRFWVP